RHRWCRWCAARALCAGAKPRRYGVLFLRELSHFLGLWWFLHPLGAAVWGHVSDHLARVAAFLAVRQVHYLRCHPDSHRDRAPPGGHYQSTTGAPLRCLRVVVTPGTALPTHTGSWARRTPGQPVNALLRHMLGSAVLAPYLQRREICNGSCSSLASY